MPTVTHEKPRSIRRYRFHEGLTFVQMAEKLGCSYQHLNLVVRGKRTSHRLLARYKALVKEATH